MLHQIRKKVQDRKQQSFEGRHSSCQSPRESPLSTPTSEFTSGFAWPNVESSSKDEDEEEMDINTIYKTPTQKAVPIESNCDDIVNQTLKLELKLNRPNQLKARQTNRKVRLQRTRSGSKACKESKMKEDSAKDDVRMEYLLRSNSVNMSSTI